MKVMPQAPYLFPAGSNLGRDNLVLHARSARHRVENYSGPLSIKTVVSGEVAWIIRRRQLVVDPSSFLIVSAGEKYSMNIDSENPVETCCVFFAPGFVERLAIDLTSPLEKLLDHHEVDPPDFPYLSALHSDRDRRAIRRVQNLARRCRHALAPSGFEEEFLKLGEDILQLRESIRHQASRIPAARPSTRQELFRRILIGREYFHSHATGPVSLATVSRAAGLSLFHFHRAFTQAFQQTPHTYLTRLRLDRARCRIASGSSVLNACLEVGFSSPSAFSRLFRSHFGEPPSALRPKFARSGRKSC